MKKVSVIIILAFCFILMYHMADAEQLKIGFMDLQRILNESTPGKKARENLETFIKTEQVKIDEQSKLIDEMKKELEIKSSVLSEEARNNKQEEIQKMLRDFKRTAQDAQDEVKRKEAELTKVLLIEIKNVLSNFAKDEGYFAVFQKAEGLVLYCDDKADITDLLLKKFNESKPSP